MSNNNPVNVQLTIRDWHQSVTGPVPIEDVLAPIKNIRDYGVTKVQVAGGTWFDLLVSNGIDPLPYVAAVCDHVGDDVTKSMLFRGHYGLSYDVQGPDALKCLVKRHAEIGVNELQNFHGMNDIRHMRLIPQITKELRDEGFNIWTQGGICIQRNPSGKVGQQKILDGLYRHAEQLVETGHRGFYAKNANGDLNRDFVYAFITGLKERFDQEISLHTHDTYGFGIQSLLAGVEAGVGCVDLLPDVMGGSTAQPSLGMFIHSMKNSDSETLRARVPQGINFDVIDADAVAAILVRGRNSGNELKFGKSLLDAAYGAGDAGGAIPALRNMDMTSFIAEKLECDLDLAHELTYYQQKRNREALGYTTNVTPHAMLQSVQAGQDIAAAILNARDEINLDADCPKDMVANVTQFKVLTNPTILYLTGGLGKVSDDADPKLQKRALELAGLDKVLEPEPIEDSPSTLPNAKKEIMNTRIEAAIKKIVEAGGIDMASDMREFMEKADKVEEPTDDQVLYMASCLKGSAFVKGEIEALKAKEPHADFQKDGLLHEHGADLEAAIYSVAYGMIELKRVRMGYHANLNNPDKYAGDLENGIKDTVDRISDYLKEENLGVEVASCVNKHIVEMAEKLGVDAKGVPDFVKKPTGIEVMLSDMPILDIYAFNTPGAKTKLVADPKDGGLSHVSMRFEDAIAAAPKCDENPWVSKEPLESPEEELDAPEPPS